MAYRVQNADFFKKNIEEPKDQPSAAPVEAKKKTYRAEALSLSILNI